MVRADQAKQKQRGFNPVFPKAYLPVAVREFQNVQENDKTVLRSIVIDTCKKTTLRHYPDDIVSNFYLTVGSVFLHQKANFIYAGIVVTACKVPGIIDKYTMRDCRTKYGHQLFHNRGVFIGFSGNPCGEMPVQPEQGSLIKIRDHLFQ